MSQHPPPLLRSHRPKTPWVILCVSLLLTAAACLSLTLAMRERNQVRFESGVRDTRERIEAQLETYLALLRGTAGLFAASGGRVTREEFRIYVGRLEVRKRYPGIQGIGFSQRILPEEASSALTLLRAEGLSGFRIWPEGAASLSFPIVFLEPADARNRAAMGFDMYSEPVRRDAMERAARTGLAALSGKVTLKQEIGPEKQAGFLIYVPVGPRGTSLAGQPSAVAGFVYAPFRAGDFFSGVLSHEPNPGVAFRVHDGAPESTRTLLYTSAPAAFSPAYEPRFSRTVQLQVAGRMWTVDFVSLPALEDAAPRPLVPGIALAGLVTSFLLFALARAQASARREVEQGAALLEAERTRLSSLFMAAPAAVAMTRGPDHVYVLSNHVNNEWLGHREVMGKSVRDAFPEAESGGFLAMLDRVYQNGETLSATEMPMHLKQEDGTEREAFLNFIYQPTRDIEGRIEGVAGFAFDVTAQVLARRELELLTDELRAGEARLRTLIDSNIVGILFWDVDGRIIEANDAFLRSIGYTREELEAGKVDWRRLTPPEWEEQDRALVAEMMETGKHRAAEKEYLRKDGTRLPLIVASSFFPGSRESGVGFVLDITERKLAEQAIKESETRARAAAAEAEAQRALLDAVLDAAPVGIIVADADGTVRRMNPANTRLWGAAPFSKGVAEYGAWKGWWADGSARHGQPLESNEWAMARALRGEVARSDLVEIEPFDAPGTRRVMMNSGAPVRNGAGEVVGAVVAQMDITARVRAEQEERKKAAELRKAVEARDIFLSVASHELKTPLTPLGLRLSQVKRQLQLHASVIPDGSRLLGNVEIAESQLRRLATLVEGLLDVTRLSEGRFSLRLEEMDAADVVRETVQSMAPHAQQVGSALTLDVRASAKGRFDRMRLGQVVTNLLSNSIKFGEGRPIHVVVDAKDERVWFTVKDEGIGIDRESLERIFHRFERGVSERHYGGLGLGLYVTRQIVEAMGGTVTVESTLGEGATFRVELPTTNREEGASKSSPA